MNTDVAVLIGAPQYQQLNLSYLLCTLDAKIKTILQVIRGKVHYTISTESRASIQFYQPSVGYAQILKIQTKWASHIESISMLIEKYVLI